MIAKFRRNAEAVLPASAIDRLIDAVFNLEKVGSLSFLARDMAAPVMQDV